VRQRSGPNSRSTALTLAPDGALVVELELLRALAVDAVTGGVA
jgi:hypothetical protein